LRSACKEEVLGTVMRLANRGVLSFKTFLSFHDVTYFFCWIAELRLHEFESSIENGNDSASSFAPLDFGYVF
jgi:hypothetical protein